MRLFVCGPLRVMHCLFLELQIALNLISSVERLHAVCCIRLVHGLIQLAASGAVCPKLDMLQA